MWILVLLLLFIAFISTPITEPVNKSWFTKVKVTLTYYYFFKVAVFADGKMFLGIFGSWISLNGVMESEHQDEQDDDAESEFQKAMEFKNSKYYKKAAKAFATSGKLFSLLGNHFQSGKAYEESYKAYKMIEQHDLSMDQLQQAINEYAKTKSSISMAARHCVTVSRFYKESKHLDKSIEMLKRGIQLLSDLDDDRIFSMKGDLGDLYAEKKDFKSASALFLEIIPSVLNFSREKYIFRHLLCSSLSRKWDLVNETRLKFIESYPAFEDSASDEFIKSLYDNRSDTNSIDELISSELMEKFNSWRDTGTGIHPFIPYENNQSGILVFVSPILFVVRAVLLFFAMVVLLILEQIVYVIPSQTGRRKYLSSMHFIIGRVCLFLLGFYYIPHNGTDKIDSMAGQVLISNHSSWIDILYFWTFYSPLFASGNQGKFCTESALQILLRTFKVEISSGSKTLSQLISEAKALGCPIVIFPERSTTNGRAILKFNVFTDPLPDWTFLLGLSYSKSDFSPTYSVGPVLTHFYNLACQLENKLVVKGTIFKNLTKDVNSDVLKSLSMLTRQRVINLTAEDKLEFNKFYISKKS